MFTIIGSDGAEYGPADARTIKSWISGGRAALYMRARRAGETEWRTLADFPEFTGASTPPPLPSAAPAQPALPLRIDSRAYADDLIARGKPLDVFECISRGWEFYKADMWPICGVTLVALLIQMATGMVPFIGGILSSVATGLVMGGIYYYYLGKMRGHRRELGDVFIGFSRMTAPLILASLVITGVTIVALLPGYFALMIGLASEAHGVAIAGGVLLFVFAVVMTYLSTVWLFTFPLIMDKQLGFWDAMNVSRRVIHAQFWRMFGLVILCGLISALGLLLCIVGVFLTAPIMLASYAHAYEDMCNPK